jgi:hypothetical protein
VQSLHRWGLEKHSSVVLLMTRLWVQANFALTCKGFLPLLLDGEIWVEHRAEVADTRNMLRRLEAAVKRNPSLITGVNLCKLPRFKGEPPEVLPTFSLPYG